MNDPTTSNPMYKHFNVTETVKIQVSFLNSTSAYKIPSISEAYIVPERTLDKLVRLEKAQIIPIALVLLSDEFCGH